MRVVDYLSVNITCDPEYIDILVAELSIHGYESMLEKEDGLEAYIKPSAFEESIVKELAEKYPKASIRYSIEEVIEKNWNEEWEKNYDPIIVEDKILVRATFHKPEATFDHEIVINPKMSFGTGHHATTYLMLFNQLKLDHRNKRVLDAGCGTAILAIMAEKLGAKRVLAYDNNAWSTENAPENVKLNDCSHVEIREGIITTLGLNESFDIILANINKNVLLDEVSEYVNYLDAGGELLLSGFYTTDEQDIRMRAEENGLSLKDKSERNNWSALLFVKS